MTTDVKLAVVGAGLIGKCHVSSIISIKGAALACIVDPSGAARVFAGTCGVDCYSSIEEMFGRTSVDGVILATPSQLHVAGAWSVLKTNALCWLKNPWPLT